jgi:hypothetical protein
MNRLRLPEPPPPLNDEKGRGADAGDLARLRDRIARHQEQRVAEAELVSDEERLRRLEAAAEAEEAARLEDHARWLESETHARWTRALTRQAVLGIGSYLLSILFFGRSAPPKEFPK